MSGPECLITTDQVLAFVAGDTTDTETIEIAEHLGTCSACCDQAVEFRTLGVCLDRECATDALRWDSFDSPFGSMYVAATEAGLAWVSWKQPDADAAVARMEERFPDHPVICDPDAVGGWRTELEEYFAGTRTVFDLDVDLSVLSEFERSVLQTAQKIPYGEVIPYAELARRIQKPKASRAVGNALGHNPVAIVVPCHRIVRSDGSLGGYTGGVEYKRRLLAIEGRLDLLMAG